MLRLRDYESSKSDSNTITLVFEVNEVRYSFTITNYSRMQKLLYILTRNTMPEIFIDKQQTVGEILDEIKPLNIDLSLYEVCKILGEVEV